MIRLAETRALCFDVFGTVVDWRRSVRRGLEAVLAENHPDGDWERMTLDWRSLYQPSMQSVRSGAREYVVLDVLHRESLMIVLEQHRVTGVSADEVEQLVALWHRLDPWPDVREGLSRLAARYRLATLSNGHLELMWNLARFADLPWHALLGAEVAQNYKPDPLVYTRSAQILNLEPARCVMVAAHNDDLRVARSLGFATAYVNRAEEYGPEQTTDLEADDQWDVVCENFGELADALT